MEGGGGGFNSLDMSEGRVGIDLNSRNISGFYRIVVGRGGRCELDRSVEGIHSDDAE